MTCSFGYQKYVFVTIFCGLLVQFVLSHDPASLITYSFCCQNSRSYLLVGRTKASQIDGYVPGEDYPIYSEIPQGLSFTCDQKLPGYYSDPEAQCQVWHWCLPSGQKYSFLCPNGTVFNQFVRVCDWWFNVDCASVTNYYGINEDLYRVPASSSQIRNNRNT